MITIKVYSKCCKEDLYPIWTFTCKWCGKFGLLNSKDNYLLRYMKLHGKKEKRNLRLAPLYEEVDNFVMFVVTASNKWVFDSK